MKKRTSIILAGVLLLIAVTSIFSGCGEGSPSLPYNAFPFGNVKKSFLYAEQNRIKVPYLNENYAPDDPNSEEYFYDDTLPEERVILLTEQSQLEEAYDEVPPIDLGQKMVAVILFSLSDCFSASLENIVFENGVLEFIFDISRQPGGVTTQPELVEWTISMDKMEAKETAVVFI